LAAIGAIGDTAQHFERLVEFFQLWIELRIELEAGDARTDEVDH
jgi:hypothetical protein